MLHFQCSYSLVEGVIWNLIYVSLTDGLLYCSDTFWHRQFSNDSLLFFVWTFLLLYCASEITKQKIFTYLTREAWRYGHYHYCLCTVPLWSGLAFPTDYICHLGLFGTAVSRNRRDSWGGSWRGQESQSVGLLWWRWWVDVPPSSRKRMYTGRAPTPNNPNRYSTRLCPGWCPACWSNLPPTRRIWPHTLTAQHISQDWGYIYMNIRMA